MVAAGSMDGSVSLLSAVSGELLCGRRVHRKYVVSLAWAADARTFVSASWDASFAVHRLQLSSDAVAGACLTSPCLHHPLNAASRRASDACSAPSTRTEALPLQPCLLLTDTGHQCKAEVIVL